MKPQLSPNEWQALSAYLDGQLSDRETRQVESRLRDLPSWQAGLEELRQTRAMLRALPKRRAPRNFTISAAQAEQLRPSRRSRSYPVLRLVSAFASFLFVMVLLSDLALNTVTRNLATASEAAPQIMQAAEPEMEAAGAAPAEESPKAPPEEAAQPPLPEDPNALRTLGNPEPTPNATEIAAMTAAPPGMGEAVPEESGTPSVELYAPAVPGEAADAALPTLASGDPANPAANSAPLREGAEPTAAPPFDPRSLLRPAEIGLAVIAVAAALAALYARRAGSR